MDLSLLVCTRNRARQLQVALDSFARIQCSRPWELVVVDNASSDDTGHILLAAQRSFPVPMRIIEEATPGLGRARQTGWQACAGRIIALTDDDCYPAVDYLEQIWHCFEEAPLGFLGGMVRLHDPTDYPAVIQELDRRVELPPLGFVPAGLIHGANLAFRREVLEAIGGFDPTLGAGTRFVFEDVDAQARASATGYPGAYDPRPVVSHHHGRKPGPSLERYLRGCDLGRGSYYAKSMLDPRIRMTYLKNWLWLDLRIIYHQRTLLPVLREWRGAVSYLLYTLRRGASRA